MTGRVQTLRSNVAGNRPSGRQPGELYVNWPDMQLGVINSTSTPQDLIAVRFFSASTSYNKGDYVVQGGNLYSALASVPPGAFNAAQWALTGGNVAVGDTAPPTPNVGQLWFDSAGGQLYVWYNDGNSTQWVIATNAAKTDLTSLVPLAGGTMTGPLILAADPTAALGAATKQYVDGTRWGDNRIINGDMRIDQRNSGASTTPTAGAYVIDRWFAGVTQASKLSFQRGSGPGSIAVGFPYYLSIGVSSAYTPLAGDNFNIQQRIEADMINDFAFGTPNAQTVTLSFWADIGAGSPTGFYSGVLINDTGNRAYPFTFNIPAINTWYKFIITIPGDTAGTWVLSGNALGASVRFDLGSGSTFRAPAGAWISGNYIGVTGANVLVATAGALYITGVKLEVGSIATPFNRKSPQESLSDCQRYYWQTGPGALLLSEGYQSAGAQPVHYQFSNPVSMRAQPTMTPSSIAYSNASGLAVAPVDTLYNRGNITITAAGVGYANYALTANAEL